jgi:hypothetical protein
MSKDKNLEKNIALMQKFLSKGNKVIIEQRVKNSKTSQWATVLNPSWNFLKMEYREKQKEIVEVIKKVDSLAEYDIRFDVSLVLRHNRLEINFSRNARNLLFNALTNADGDRGIIQCKLIAKSSAKVDFIKNIFDNSEKDSSDE